MDQGGDVVFFQAGFAADQHRSGQGILRGLPDRLAQALGVAAAAHDAASDAALQVGGQALQVREGRRLGGALPIAGHGIHAAEGILSTDDGGQPLPLHPWP